MKKKIINFGLIILLLLTGISTASALNNNTISQSNIQKLNDLPDLIVEKITVEPIYSYYFDDWDLVVNATIKNQGDSTAYFDEFPNVWWSRFYIDGEDFDSDRITRLEPGSSQKIQGIFYHWDKEPGDYEIKVWADWLDRIEESNEKNNNKTIKYTQKTYKKTKNEKNDLPNFLAGTILDGSKNIVISQDGTPPPYLSSETYDIVISRQKRDQITQEARERYIQTYGIDPYTIKEKAPNKLQNFKEILNSRRHNDHTICQSSDYGPYALKDENGNSKIYVYMVYAWGKYEVNDNDKSNCYNDVKIAINNIIDKFDVDKVEIIEFYGKNYWNAKDCTTNSETQFNDFQEDCEYLRQHRSNILLFGWIKKSTNSGKALGYYSIAHRGFTWFQNKFTIAQHEMSHNFGCPDHGYFHWPPCIMSYGWMYFDNIYCNNCHKTINNRIHKTPNSKKISVAFNQFGGSVEFNKNIYTVPKFLDVQEGEYKIVAYPKSGYTFEKWIPSGCVLIDEENLNKKITTVAIADIFGEVTDGGLIAVFNPS